MERTWENGIWNWINDFMVAREPSRHDGEGTEFYDCLVSFLFFLSIFFFSSPFRLFLGVAIVQIFR